MSSTIEALKTSMIIATNDISRTPSCCCIITSNPFIVASWSENFVQNFITLSQLMNYISSFKIFARISAMNWDMNSKLCSESKVPAIGSCVLYR